MVGIPKNLKFTDLERWTTDETVFLRRRTLLRAAAVFGLGTIVPTHARFFDAEDKAGNGSQPLPEVPRNPAFATVDRPLTGEKVAARYNNFYEFGSSKNIWQQAQALPTDEWRLEVTGLVHKPLTLDRDDLFRLFPLEERVYRFRCVEAWAMVVPWIGFPMKALIDRVQPLGKAQYVKFVSFYNPKITPGPRGISRRRLPWPYTEGLRLDEMANELAFFAVGIYGHELPKQHGAPIRAVIPWKYGFKGAKSLVRIEFVAKRPATFWNTLVPQEYDFWANVDPDVPHPRWSQKQERLIGPGSSLMWQVVPTRKYNGYGEYVAHLYQ